MEGNSNSFNNSVSSDNNRNEKLEMIRQKREGEKLSSYLSPKHGILSNVLITTKEKHGRLFFIDNARNPLFNYYLKLNRKR